MRKRRVVNAWGLSEIPLTPVAVDPNHVTSLKKFTEQENQRIAAELIAEKKRDDKKRMAPVRAIENELKAAAREREVKVRKFFSRPLQTIASFGLELAPIDYVGDYPTAGAVDNRADLAAQNAVKDSLASRGTMLTEDGWNRLGAYLEVLRYGRNVTLANTRSWELAIQRLYEMGCFGSEISGYQPQPVRSVEAHTQPAVNPHAEPSSNLDQLLKTTSAESRSGRATLLAAVGEEVQNDAKAMFDRFSDEVVRQFNHYLTKDEIDAIVRVMKVQNKNFMRLSAWHEGRRIAASAGYIDSEKLLDADEKLALELERMDRPMTFEEKRAFNRKVAALHKGTPLLG